MKIFSQALIYWNHDLVDPYNHYDKARLCVKELSKFFDLPSKNKMVGAQIGNRPQYVMSVYDRKKKNAVCIRKDPYDADNRNIQVERADDEGHIDWARPGFYYVTEDKMLELFKLSGKKRLYVVLEEV